MNAQKRSPASLDIAGTTIRCSGAWSVRYLEPLERRLKGLQWPSGALDVDVSGVQCMDTGGAWVLYRLMRQWRKQGREVVLAGASPEIVDLLRLVEESGVTPEAVRPSYRTGPLEQLGRSSVSTLVHGLGLLAFLGQMGSVWLRQLVRPDRVRWRTVVHELAEAGYKALGIVGLLSFLLGVVIAYQGGVQLRQYAASLFVADLVGLSMVRELAPLITAIIVAGRTGSSYTAQIGTMKVTEEVDALRSIGIAPMELLVLPKLLALFIALPLLTVFADVLGVMGGMVMASAQLNISFPTFIDRVGVAVTVQSYLVGVGKAPVFALIIATIGCYQGFQVSGSAESVGRRTTMSVVQSILAVIVVDAAFSVAFSYLGI